MKSLFELSDSTLKKELRKLRATEYEENKFQTAQENGAAIESMINAIMEELSYRAKLKKEK